VTKNELHIGCKTNRFCREVPSASSSPRDLCSCSALSKFLRCPLVAHVKYESTTAGDSERRAAASRSVRGKEGGGQRWHNGD
jgi:hypothetical protein